MNPGVSRRFALLALCCWLSFFPIRQAGGGEAASWTRYFGGPGSVVTDVVSDRHGIWVAGLITEDGTRPDLWIALLDGSGKVRWQQRLPARGYQLFPKLVPGRETVRVIAGTPSPSVPAADGGSLTASRLWIGTVTPDGRLVGQHTLAPHRVTVVQAVSPMGDGGVLLAGLAESGADTTSKGWLARLDKDGNLAWQHLMPQVSWLSSLSKTGVDQWLIAGTAHENGDTQRSWLAVVDPAGHILHSWKPDIREFSLSSALATPDALWLAGEGSTSRDGARLIRVDRTGEHIHEYPVTGFSVLRLIAVTPHGLLAGGDGMGDRSPAGSESAPGWLRLPQGGQHSGSLQASAVSPEVRRLRHLPHGELRAWSFRPAAPGGFDQCVLTGAGTIPDRGSWVGCIGPVAGTPDRKVLQKSLGSAGDRPVSLHEGGGLFGTSQ